MVGLRKETTFSCRMFDVASFFFFFLATTSRKDDTENIMSLYSVLIGTHMKDNLLTL